jgi:hypothetical protein
LIPELTQQMELARIVWERDQKNRTPLMLPHRLARKYPAYQFNWSWAWLFPAHHPCCDPRSGVVVRFRMHEANVQRAVKKAISSLEWCQCSGRFGNLSGPAFDVAQNVRSCGHLDIFLASKRFQIGNDGTPLPLSNNREESISGKRGVVAKLATAGSD